MLVIVLEQNELVDGQLSEDKLKGIIEKAKNTQNQMQFRSEEKSEHTHKASKLVGNSSPALYEEKHEEIPVELKEALDMYMKAMDIGQEKDRYKLQYNNDGVKIHQMKSYRDSIYQQLNSEDNVDLPMYFIKGMNQKAVSFINSKKQRFKEGVQVYEDLLAWTSENTDEAREVRGKIWFNLATAYQKGPGVNFEKRKAALISGFNESPEGSRIKDRVLSVLNRDYAGLVV